MKNFFHMILFLFLFLPFNVALLAAQDFQSILSQIKNGPEAIIPSVCSDQQPVVRAKRPGLKIIAKVEPPPMTQTLLDIERAFKLGRDNPLFRGESRYLPTKDFVDYETAISLMDKTMGKFPGLLSTANGSLLFHGSQSSALLAFTDYAGEDRGKLIPTGQLLEKGRVPFGGAMDGISKGKGGGINNNSISTVFFSELEEALSYAGARLINGEVWNYDEAQAKHWSPEWAKEKMKEKSSKEEALNAFEEVIEEREKAWSRLSAVEKDLVENPFPVLFGLRPEKRESSDDLAMAPSDVYLEILVRNGFSPNEIRVVYVPQAQLEKVAPLLGGVSVVALESLTATPAKPR